VIGVIGNVAPGPVRELTRAAAPGGDTGRAAALVERLAPLTQALFLETNPAPLKAALAALGLCGGELRLPMVSVTEETRKTLAEALRFAGFALEL
jgi:4-hydroxy-tetrahydrodipicolinate synthase